MADTHLARTTVQARESRGTVQSRSTGQAQVDVALGPGEVGRTRARVKALARVEARAAVLARRVVGTVVQVLVAEHATPSLFAQTLPRLLAVTVHATRVYLTLVTSGSRPTGVTSATRKEKKINKTVLFFSISSSYVSRQYSKIAINVYTNRNLHIILYIRTIRQIFRPPDAVQEEDRETTLIITRRVDAGRKFTF